MRIITILTLSLLSVLGIVALSFTATIGLLGTPFNQVSEAQWKTFAFLTVALWLAVAVALFAIQKISMLSYRPKAFFMLLVIVLAPLAVGLFVNANLNKLQEVLAVQIFGVFISAIIFFYQMLDWRS